MILNVDGTGDPLTLRGHQGPVASVAFDATGTRVVTASDDGTARVWTVGGAELQAKLRAATNACLPADFRASSLAEPPVEAWKKHAECQLRHDRCPAPWRFDPADPSSAESFLSALLKEDREKYEAQCLEKTKH